MRWNWIFLHRLLVHTLNKKYLEELIIFEWEFSKLVHTKSPSKLRGYTLYSRVKIIVLLYLNPFNSRLHFRQESPKFKSAIREKNPIIYSLKIKLISTPFNYQRERDGGMKFEAATEGVIGRSRNGVRTTKKESRHPPKKGNWSTRPARHREMIKLNLSDEDGAKGRVKERER